MLWKEKIDSFPISYNMALKRFNLLRKRLKRDKVLKEKYTNTINTYIQNGYASKRSKKELSNLSVKTLHLLHHSVFNKNKPEKFRMFFDTTAEHKDNSLKNFLLTRPDLVNNLIGVLLRFCNHKILFSADIEAMYQQVRVSCDGADSIMFLLLSRL